MLPFGLGHVSSCQLMLLVRYASGLNRAGGCEAFVRKVRNLGIWGSGKGKGYDT